MLSQLHLYQPLGEPGRVHRHVQLTQDVGQGARVVFVAVGNQYPLDPVAVLREVGDVGDDQVYPQHVLLREQHPGVNDDNVAIVLQGHHVLPDLAETAQRDHFQRLRHNRILRTC